MLHPLLAWIRRALAIGVLAAMLLPMVTVKGCGEDDPKITHTGWGLVQEEPTLVSIPLFAILAAALTFITPRIRTAVGRLITALVKIVMAGAAGTWTFIAFFRWSFTMTVWTEVGFWAVFGACLGILGCDLAEAAASWITWLRWKRSRTIAALEDPLIRFTARGGMASGPVLTSIVVLGTVVLFASDQAWPTPVAWLFIGSIVLLIAAWGALASLAGWGIRRGLGWARALTHVGAWATVIVIASLLYATLASMTQDFDKWENLRLDAADAGLAWGWVAIVVLMAWLAWTWWTVRVVLGWRRRWFPSRRAKVATPDGKRQVRVPRCPVCRARLWLSLDGTQLVCRPCAQTFPAAVDRSSATRD